MNLLSRLLNRKKQNPYYIKLTRSLIRKGVNIEIKSAYFLFGIPYTKTSIEKIKKAITENKLNAVREEAPYDVQVDNIELYLIEDTNSKHHIVILLDPYELYERENILDMMPSETIDFEKEIIFP